MHSIFVALFKYPYYLCKLGIMKRTRDWYKKRLRSKEVKLMTAFEKYIKAETVSLKNRKYLNASSLTNLINRAQDRFEKHEVNLHFTIKEVKRQGEPAFQVDILYYLHDRKEKRRIYI